MPVHLILLRMPFFKFSTALPRGYDFWFTDFMNEEMQKQHQKALLDLEKINGTMHSLALVLEKAEKLDHISSNIGNLHIPCLTFCTIKVIRETFS